MAESNNKTIYNFSFAANHLFGISLMKDESAKFQKTFVYLSLRPGEQNDAGQRTFSKTSIAMKLVPIRIGELGHALSAYARGQQKMVGKFGFMVDSSRAATGGSDVKKSMYLTYLNEEGNDPCIMVNVKTSAMSKGCAIKLSIPSALAIADACDYIYKLSLEEDRKDQASYSGGHFTTNNHSTNQTVETKASEMSDDGFGPF